MPAVLVQPVEGFDTSLQPAEISQDVPNRRDRSSSADQLCELYVSLFHVWRGRSSWAAVPVQRGLSVKGDLAGSRAVLGCAVGLAGTGGISGLVLCFARADDSVSVSVGWRWDNNRWWDATHGFDLCVAKWISKRLMEQMD